MLGRMSCGKAITALLIPASLVSGFFVLPLRGRTSGAAAVSNSGSNFEWIGEIRNARDVTGKGSWFKRVVKAIVGTNDRQKELVQPEGVAVDSHGRIFVADPRAGIVRVFDPARKRYQELRAPDSNPMVAPVDVAVDGSGRAYVSDAARARIFIFSDRGKFLRTIGGVDHRESIFWRCTGIAIDAQRQRLYVVDTGAMRVVVLTLDGHVIEKFGKPGASVGEFNFPTFIAVAPDGSVWVSDSLNFRVQHFDAEGRFLSAFGRVGDAPGEFYRPKGIAVDGDGNVYVVEGMYDRVQIYNPIGRMLFVFGSTGSGPNQLDLPTGIALGENGQIFVSDALNARLDIFRLKQKASTLGAGEGY